MSTASSVSRQPNKQNSHLKPETTIHTVDQSLSCTLPVSLPVMSWVLMLLMCWKACCNRREVTLLSAWMSKPSNSSLQTMSTEYVSQWQLVSVSLKNRQDWNAGEGKNIRKYVCLFCDWIIVLLTDQLVYTLHSR